MDHGRARERPRTAWPPSRLSRRGFLRAATGLVLFSPLESFALRAERKSLSLFHTQTHLGLSVVYWAHGRYVPDALGRIDELLGDHRTGDVHPIDPGLLDLLHDVRILTGSRAPVQVISGYRSPATNEWLRRRNRGVAKHSLHMQGMAIDVRVADVNPWQLRQAAVALGRGGVGYYRRSGFVHLDVGPVRTW